LGVSQGVLADVPLFESFPPASTGAIKYVVAHVGHTNEKNKIASANLFILIS
jgi:hypothetical protein